MPGDDVSDEFANDPKEVHALWAGFLDGLSIRPAWDRHPDAAGERQYYNLTFVASEVLKLVAAAIAGICAYHCWRKR